MLLRAKNKPNPWFFLQILQLSLPYLDITLPLHIVRRLFSAVSLRTINITPRVQITLRHHIIILILINIIIIWDFERRDTIPLCTRMITNDFTRWFCVKSYLVLNMKKPLLTTDLLYLFIIKLRWTCQNNTIPETDTIAFTQTQSFFLASSVNNLLSIDEAEAHNSINYITLKCHELPEFNFSC